ncbi:MULTISPECIES: hypothetical protein [unclassified Leptolyngbya]|uniref:hypothetical protein n=1 Tax=unclassified Leptolyngbya TaxID=2650499 RepID=UPI0016827307|nr:MULTISPECIES: hypothetical protein [unclassified Leptolyngbya]MBD1909091.1 hypothetical protein [Leptolyngbya sp. FACHB-8]MBD2156998.1 hypothetical protein [Leptolyngbya sp. FACHB-16]
MPNPQELQFVSFVFLSTIWLTLSLVGVSAIAPHRKVTDRSYATFQLSVLLLR